MADGPLSIQEQKQTQEVEITPDMVERARVIYREWHGENQGFFADGADGDVGGLLERLLPIFSMMSKSESDRPKSC
jgi:hypothetical protein